MNRGKNTRIGSAFTIEFCGTWNPMVRGQLDHVHLEDAGIHSGSDDGGVTGRANRENMEGPRMILTF